MKSHLTLLVSYLKPQWPRVLLLAGLILGGIALQLANPQIMRYVLDQARAGAPQQQLLLAAGLFLLFGIGQAVVTVASNYLGTDVSWTATNQLRADLALHCLRLDMAFHNAHTPGELIERVDGDVSKLASFFSQLVLRILANGLLIAGVILLLTREDWRMGLAAAGYAGLVFALLRAVQTHTIRLWSKISVADARLISLLEERLTGREDVRANGGEGYVLWRLAQAQGERFRAIYAARLMAVFTFASSHMLFVLATALAFAIGIYLYLNGQATIGTVYLIAYYVGILQAPLMDFRNQMGDLQQAAASVGRIRELLDHRSSFAEIAPASDSSSPRLPNGSLPASFSHVSFAYAGRNGNEETHTSVLRDLSFNLPANRVLGLLGRTGSGKTTLTRLLFRLYDPTQGTIRLGGEDLRDVNLREVRCRVGMVTQEVQLFQGSLRDNITLFNPRVDDERILDALRELGLWTWYQAQPDGLDTVLQAGGLSAGEAQLLAFVRIFLKDPGLVLLDEASSRLDPVTEQLLERAIDRLLQNRTGIIIAHRLDTVQRADDILILEEGRAVEYGARANLAADPTSRFYQLLQTGLQETLA